MKIKVDEKKKKYITRSGIGCFSVTFIFLAGFLIFALIERRDTVFVIIISAILFLVIMLFLFIFLKFKKKGSK